MWCKQIDDKKENNLTWKATKQTKKKNEKLNSRNELVLGMVQKEWQKHKRVYKIVSFVVVNEYK